MSETWKMPEWVLISDTIKKIDENAFSIRLLRGWMRSLAQDHEEGLWVVSSTGGRSLSGPQVYDRALKLPAMSSNATCITVNARVANYLDVGYVLMRLRVVE